MKKDILQALSFCALTSIMIGGSLLLIVATITSLSGLIRLESKEKQEKRCMKYYPKVPLDQCIWEHSRN